MYTRTDEILRPKAQFQDIVTGKNLSVKACNLCGNQVAVRDVRQYPILCANCEGKRSSMGRYQNFQHGQLTPDERQKILTDKTKRRGPFFGGKK